ncbi:hypothetical protein SAMN04487956_12247 [Halomonas saccharevitans]|uniref:Chain length determinant protein n=2 Tax=Halomonas saccharevitans TaxID=416872 RepID=A0A1I7B4D6_9GAMM|nr:hypothetical protein SAMN04487956_12247 [Halomonas saccharevitans]
MAAVFLVIVLAGLAYALSMERTYEYVSIYQVAEQKPSGSNGPAALELPGSIVAKVSNLYLGSVTRELIAENSLEKLPFDVDVSNPSDTLLVRFVSKATTQNESLVKALHGSMLDKIKADQGAQLEQRRASLESQLASARRSLEATQGSSRALVSDLVTSYINRIADLEDELAYLRDGRVVETAVQGLQPVGTGRSLIMALAIVLGAMIAVMSAFIMQFAASVRDSLVEEG